LAPFLQQKPRFWGFSPAFSSRLSEPLFASFFSAGSCAPNYIIAKSFHVFDINASIFDAFQLGYITY
jgi:hypothetical protein